MSAIPEDVREAMKEAAYVEWKRRVVEQITAEPREHLDAMIDAALSVVEMAPEVECTCGFGGFHEETNPRCARNGGGLPI